MIDIVPARRHLLSTACQFGYVSFVMSYDLLLGLSCLAVCEAYIDPDIDNCGWVRGIRQGEYDTSRSDHLFGWERQARFLLHRSVSKPQE